MGRLQLGNPVDDALRPGRAQEGEQVADRSPVEPTLDLRALEDRLQLGREQEPLSGDGVVERLDPEAVSRQQELLAATIPHGESKHPPELLHAAETVLL